MTKTWKVGHLCAIRIKQDVVMHTVCNFDNTICSIYYMQYLKKQNLRVVTWGESVIVGFQFADSNRGSRNTVLLSSSHVWLTRSFGDSLVLNLTKNKLTWAGSKWLNDTKVVCNVGMYWNEWNITTTMNNSIMLPIPKRAIQFE